MKYIGIVNQIKDKHQSGFYGRTPISEEEAEDILEDLSESFGWTDVVTIGLGVASVIPVIGLYGRIASGAAALAPGLIKSFKENQNKISIQRKITSSKARILIIENDTLNNNYNIDDELLYGLFDDFISKKKALKQILKSKGGSELNIIERNFLPDNFGHLHNGHFNEGIYVLHPKNENILIPLNNSNRLIQSLILEETIRAYEALGAKRIVIEDRTEINAQATGKKKGVEASLNVESKKTVLREKKFGKGIFSPERALKDKYFIQDIPSVMTTIESRKQGNQLEERFAENVSLSLGLDVGVLNLYKAKSNFNYNREWFFHVEFYDKNEMLRE